MYRYVRENAGGVKEIFGILKELQGKVKANEGCLNNWQGNGRCFGIDQSMFKEIKGNTEKYKIVWEK